MAFTDGLFAGIDSSSQGTDLTEEMNAYKPKFLAPAQVSAESGGRQLGSDGEPLVGKYRDGSEPAGNKKAYGAGQIQIATAKAAAEKHGIPWDQQRLLNDKNYNLQLADAHMGDLIQHYGGDRAKAIAAYHQGIKNVDRAVELHGANWIDGIGPEGQAYVKKLTGQGPGGGSMATQIDFTDPTQAQATSAEKTAMTQPRATVTDVFDPSTTSQVADAQTDSNQKLSFADSLLQTTTAESQAVRAQQTQALTDVVDKKQAINDQTKQDLDSLTSLAEPVWEKRTALAKQMLHLDDMPRLKQGILSMFDPDYNRANLKGRIKTQTDGLNALDAVFDERYKHSQLLSQLADTDYNNHAQVADLILKNGGEDVRLALQSFNLSTQKVDNILHGVQADSALDAAKNQARQSVLSGMSDGQINAALQDATGNGGTTMVNGVELRSGELKDAQARLTNQSLTLANAKMSLEKGNLELFNMNQDKLLEGSTLADVQSMVSNGYTFRGVQMDPVKVGARLDQLQQTQKLVVAQSQMQTAPGVVSQLLNQYNGVSKVRGARFVSLFGKVPDEFNTARNGDAAMLTAFNQGLQKAKQTGTVDEFMASQAPVIQSMIANQTKVVNAAVSRWAGGNKDLAAVGTAWMNGDQLTSESAIKGMIQMARYGTPAGTKFTGTAAKVYTSIQNTVKDWDAKNGAGSGTDFATAMAGGQTGSQTEKQNQLVQSIKANVAKVYNQTLGDEAYNSIPDIAKQMGHPFGQINKQDWLMATQAGDADGLAATAAQYGFNGQVDQFKAMKAGGVNGPAWQAYIKGKTGDDASYPKMISRLQANQLQETMAYLDVHQSKTGWLPSQALADLVTKPEFIKQLKQGGPMDSNGSFGGFVSSMAAGSGFDQEIDNMVDNISAGYQQRQSAVMRAKRQRVDSLANSPIERTKFILHSISGLSPEQEQAILGAASKVAPTGGIQKVGDVMNLPGTPDIGTAQDWDQMSRISSFIMSGKTGDPHLDSALRIARKQWETLSGPVNQAIDKYTAGVK